MTIATTRTRELEVGHLVTMAYRLAGLLNEHQACPEVKAIAGRDLLETIMKHLQVYGVFARAVTLSNITLVSGTNTYNLPTDVFDVFGSAVHIESGDDPDNPEHVFAMRPVSREERQLLAAQAATGPPSLFYVDKTTVPNSVWLYPTPNEAGYVRFQTHRLAADSNNATATPDLERYWAQYLIWELAYQLAMANSLPIERVAMLRADAKEKLTMCRAYATPRGSFQIGLDHATGWSR